MPEPKSIDAVLAPPKRLGPQRTIGVGDCEAQRVIDLFNGAGNLRRALAAASGKPVGSATVYKWVWPKEKGGTGGYIPAPRRDMLKVAARLYGVVLPEHLRL